MQRICGIHSRTRKIIHGLHVTSRPPAPLRPRHAGAPRAPPSHLIACAYAVSLCFLSGFHRSSREMPPVYSRPAFNEAFYAGLIGSARARYQEKVKLCDDVDPYTLRLSADTTMDVSAFPEVSHGCIVNCLVFSSSFATLEEMKAYKSLESHNYFTSGWVKTLSAKRLQGEKVLLLGDVGCSPRFPCRILFITFRGIPWLVSGACRRHARLELGAEKKRTDTVHLTITQKRSLCARV